MNEWINEEETPGKTCFYLLTWLTAEKDEEEEEEETILKNAAGGSDKSHAA